VAPREVYWSDGGELLLLACEESYFVLRYDASIVAAAIQVHLFLYYTIIVVVFIILFCCYAYQQLFVLVVSLGMHRAL
jgi:hypothetical protein